MATTVPLIRAAIETAVKGITPTHRPDKGKFRLLEGDEDPGSMPVTSGAHRRFLVLGEEGEEGDYQAFTDGAQKIRFFITVIYPTERALNTKLRDLIEYDLHDLRVALNQYTVWAENLADPTALIHAIIPERGAVSAQQGRLLLVVPLDVEYLESVI